MERFGITPYTSTSQRFSVRTIFMFVIAAFSAALLWTALFTQPTQAQSAGAEWDGAALRYEGRQYIDSGKAQRNQFPGISADAPYFMAGSTTTGGSNTTPRDVFILYFTPGTDPPSATSAQHVQFTFNPSDKTYTNPSAQTSVAINGEYNQNATTCAIEGVGWIVCSASTFLAKGMDWIFEAISGFMEVQPLTTSQDSGLYVGWDVMRNFANVAFIIVFLIIVYGQLSGAYAGTYGIKKLLPRLIIAAILVNLSYIICAIAVDLSNILGYSLQNVFIELRNQIFQVDNETWNSEYMLSWESITGFVLSGGTALLGAGIAGFSFLAASGGTIMGAIFLLLPALMGLVIAILVVLLILAARQAIITVMILIAPLAFVAYLLPNTEKWFDKWRGLLMTMLIFFPAFAVVFGGSQLAGAVIIQNANSINILILGMIVQVAPLVITPFLLKFSGSLLGRIAGLVNNPNKGLIDRTRKFSESRAARHRNRGISGQKLNGRPDNLRRRNFARNASRWANNFGNNFEQKAKNSQAAAENAYHQSRGYQKAHDNAALINTDKEAIDARHAQHDDTQRATRGTALHARALELANDKQGAEAAKNRAAIEVEKLRVDSSSDLHMNTLRTKAGEATVEQLNAQNSRMMEEYKSGKLVRTGEADSLMREMKESAIQTSAEKQGNASAQYEMQRAVLTAMTADSLAGDALRKVAAGVSGKVGETRARAQAVSSINKLDGDVIKSNMELLKAEATQAGTTIKNFSANLVGGAIDGSAVNLDTDKLRAALQLQADEKNMSIFEAARGSMHIDQSIVSEIIAENAGTFKGAGGFHLQADPNLNVTVHGVNFETELAKARIGTLGNVSAENLANVKAGWISDLAKPENLSAGITAARNSSNPDDQQSIVKAYMGIKRALTTPDILGKLNDREQELRDIEKALAAALGQDPTEDTRPTLQ